MFIDKRRFYVFIGVSMLAFAISGCGFLTKVTEQGTASQLGETLPNTEATPETEIASDMLATPEMAATPVVVSPTKEIGGYAELMDNLRSTGAQVEAGGDIDQPLLEEYDISGQVLKVSGTDVQVFEFDSELFRAVASSQISADGSTIAMTAINWADQPNFWAKGRLVVLYVGTDAAMIDLISDMMGAPITTHQ